MTNFKHYNIADEASAKLIGSDYRFASQICLLWQFRNRLELVPEFKILMQERRQIKHDYFKRLWENSLSFRFLYDAFNNVPKTEAASKLASFVEKLENNSHLKSSDISLRPLLTLENVIDLMLMLELFFPHRCKQTLSQTRLFLCMHTFQFYQHSLGPNLANTPLSTHLKSQKGVKKGDGSTLRLAYEPVTRGVYCLESNSLEFNPFLCAVSDMEASALTKAIDDIKAAAFNVSDLSKAVVFGAPALWPQPLLGMAPVAEHFQLVPCTSGLRGLRNLGNSCYMNVILQAFSQSIALKSMFLSDYHPHGNCSVPNCTTCELDKLIVNLNNGEITPYAPTSFLMNLWLCNTHLATAAQHDAHEFYVSVLSQLHENLVQMELSVNERSVHATASTCCCPAHSIFYGTEVSHITCSICRNETQKEEAFGNICLSLKGASLALAGNFALAGFADAHETGSTKKRKTDSTATGKVGRPRKNAVSSMTASSPLATSPAVPEVAASPLPVSEQAPTLRLAALSIVECLQRYTAPEKLNFSCSNCKRTTPATKHYSFKQLPRVLTIQLKRFEHTVKTARKINTFVHFPSRLNMSPYTTYSVKSRQVVPDAATPSQSVANLSSSQPTTPVTPLSPSITRAVPNDPGYNYNLFCVVHHIGELESGHYISYINSRDQWFQIDDDVVTLVDIKMALSSTAYMLFYSREASSVQLPLAETKGAIKQEKSPKKQEIVIEDDGSFNQSAVYL